MKGILIVLILALTVITPFGQGNIDLTFNVNGTKGYNTFPLPVGEEIVGADTQLYSPEYDHIVVVTRKDSLGQYIVRQFDRSSGAFIKSRIITIGGNAYANTMVVLGGLNEIFIAGTGASPNVCTVVKVNADLSGEKIQNITLPAPLTRCVLTDIEIYQGQVMVLGTSLNPATTKLGLTQLRFYHHPYTPATHFIPNPNWYDSSNVKGFARLEFTNTGQSSRLMNSVAFALTPTRVFMSALFHGPNPNPGSGTVIVWYSPGITNLPNLNVGFGEYDTSLNPIPNRGTFILKNFMATDMIASDGQTLLLSGSDLTNHGKFSLVRLKLPANSQNDVTRFPIVDFMATTESKSLKLNVDSNGIISTGNCGVSSFDICLAQYDRNATGSLMNKWTNPTNNLWQFDFMGGNANLGFNGDRRRIKWSSPTGTNLRFVATAVQRSAKKNIVVAQKTNSSSNEILIMRLNK